MCDRVKRGRFVLLRAQGKSIRAITEELGISTSKVWKWNGEHALKTAHLAIDDTKPKHNRDKPETNPRQNRYKTNTIPMHFSYDLFVDMVFAAR
jgi:hypothetical protein